MVDVSSKEPTRRTATASGRILIPRVAYELITIPAGMDKHDDPPQDAAILAPLRKTKEKARSKGDVLTVAQLAAIIGCKRTWELIPLCHPLALSHIAVTLHPETHRPIPSATRSASGAVDATRSDCDIGAGAGAAEKKGSQGLAYSIVCRATVSCEGKTGVEMEALTAVSVGLLTVWDMLKAVAGREMVIGDVVVERKAGGKSGDFVRAGARL